MPKIISPLGYPGGKRLAIKKIVPFFPTSTKEIVSPFIGGASIELYCTQRGIRVYGYDLFKPLVDFWQALLLDSELLIEEILKWYPINQEKFTYLLNHSLDFETTASRGAAYYVLNKTSFSGFAYNRKNCVNTRKQRLNLSSINKLRNYKLSRLSVNEMSWSESLVIHKDILAYCDPPYYFRDLSRATLYGFNGQLHRQFDHEGLAQTLKSRDKWVLSYNNVPEIRDLYNDFEQVPLSWKYSLSSTRYEGAELLIMSKDISEIYHNGLLF